jgi:trehalose/maltose hydrolase-like predicted phosphorylase
MAAIASVLPVRRVAAVVASVGVVFACMSAIWPDGRAEASVRAAAATNASGSSWVLSTSQFVNQFDAAPYVGNGYFSQRIPAAGMGFLSSSNPIGWPLGTPRFTDALAAGLYANTTASLIYPGMSKQVIALIPTWSTLTFSTPSGDTYAPASVTASQISNYVQTEDTQTGTVTTSGVWTSPHGQQASFMYRAFTDRARKHVGVVSLTLTPQWSGRTNVTSLLDGQGASRLQPAGAGVDLATHTSHVSSTAIGTGFPVAESATLQFALDRFSDTAVGLDQPQTAGEQLNFTAQAGHTYVFTKYVAVVTGRDSQTPTVDASTGSQQAAGLGLPKLQQENAAAWATDVWNGDIVVNGDLPLQTAIHANSYDLYASIRNDSPDTIGPSGLSSDGYAGMIFWDSDIWMYPAILAAHPDIAKVAVDYRFNTLQAAKHDAAANGYQGAFYPWTAGDDGYTGADCYGTTTNSSDTIISDPNKSCSEELHLQADIALAQWEYYQATGDTTWLATHGWPVLQALAEFWVSKAVPCPKRPTSGCPKGGYAIDTVQPPDESHTDVNNSAYTNAAAATALQDATKAAQVVPGATAPAIWTTVANGLKQTMPFDSSLNIYNEFDGYQGDTIKQADVVMLTYPLEFPMASGVGLNDLNYYAPRTSLQGPAMTDAIHSIDASALNVPGCSAYTYMLRSYEPFLRPPYDQFAETRSGSDTGFNFLTGVGGFSQVFEYGFSGLRFGADAVTLDPSLPPQLPGVTLNDLQWHKSVFTVAIGPTSTTVSLVSGPALPVDTPTGQQTVGQGQSITMPTRRPDLQPTNDLARCESVSASSFVAGDDPVAAVDGSTATAWVPTGPQATLTVQLAKSANLTSATITRSSSAGYSLETSTDGSNWHVVATAAPTTPSGVDQFQFAQPTEALFVRLAFPGGNGAVVPDINELTVSAG